MNINNTELMPNSGADSPRTEPLDNDFNNELCAQAILNLSQKLGNDHPLRDFLVMRIVHILEANQIELRDALYGSSFLVGRWLSYNSPKYSEIECDREWYWEWQEAQRSLLLAAEMSSTPLSGFDGYEAYRIAELGISSGYDLH